MPFYEKCEKCDSRQEVSPSYGKQRLHSTHHSQCSCGGIKTVHARGQTIGEAEKEAIGFGLLGLFSSAYNSKLKKKKITQKGDIE